MSSKNVSVSVSFDSKNQVRILEAENFSKTEALVEECSTFASKLTRFEQTVALLMDTLGAQADRIDRQKMMAIGIKNKVESEAENRKRKQLQMQAEISQKKAEIERVASQIESLGKVLQEQKIIIDQLQLVE